MPELPEVETVRRGLLSAFEGHRFRRVEARRSDLRIPFPLNFAGRLEGRRVLQLKRRAKYILAELDNGETLVIHLGMSGRIRLFNSKDSANLGPHDHVYMETDAPAAIVFTDHRRFGLMTLIHTASIHSHPLFKDLGMEPLLDSFSADWLKRALHGKKTPIKSALLDQRVVAGLGNIYVCEALWRAGISPRRRAARIRFAEVARLAPAIQAVLREAIEAGGSSLRDHRQTNGELGYFQKSFAAYDREGEPCGRAGCHGVIRRIVQSGRSTFYCRTCQK